jgi:GNAT superfamily N-acetyltransferase
MLRGGARAITASDPQTHTLIAMAWHTAAPFFVEEIDHTLDPAGGVYLFGDFVAPASRGRGLQRALVRQRLALAPNLTAHTIIRDNNLPSLKSYQALGFTPTTRLTSHRWLGLGRWHCTPIAGADGRLPAFDRHPGKRLVPLPYAASSST